MFYSILCSKLLITLSGTYCPKGLDTNLRVPTHIYLTDRGWGGGPRDFYESEILAKEIFLGL